jgi:glycosyltransferase involved in cell wall biosynthesis
VNVKGQRVHSTTRPGDSPLAVSIASCCFDPADRDPEALLSRYHALTGWAEALVAAGAEPVNVVQQFSRDAVVTDGSVQYHFVEEAAPPRPPAWFWGGRMTNRVRRLAPNVVHVDGLVFPMVVRALRMKLPSRTAIVVQDHGGFHAHSPAFRTWRGRRFYRWGLGAADGFLFTVRDQAAPWLRAGVIAGQDAVYEVLESSTGIRSLPIADDALPGRPAILWVGRLDPNKDPLTVLDGFERAAAVLPDAALTLVYGEDDLLPAVKARIARSPRLARRVHLRGRMERRALPALYAVADVFVLGSHHEVACFSLLEALSFGVTPVVTDIAPFRSITEGGRIGALFTPGDAAGLGRAIERLGREDFAVRRASVLAHFERDLSWAAVGRKAFAAYRTALARRGESWAQER